MNEQTKRFLLSDSGIFMALTILTIFIYMVDNNSTCEYRGGILVKTVDSVEVPCYYKNR